MECKKCQYFNKIKDTMHGSHFIVGFCKLRQRHISDETIQKELCKDKAVIHIESKPKGVPIKFEKGEKESEDEFVRKAAFGG
jgi:hypothetical protein